MRRRAAKTLTRKEWRVLARSTPPQKPVYPKNEPQPRRQAPQRPVYTYDADVPRQPRKPAGGRVVYDYNKSAGASSGVPAGSPARPAAPFVNTAPQAPQQPPGVVDVKRLLRLLALVRFLQRDLLQRVGHPRGQVTLEKALLFLTGGTAHQG